MSPRILHATEAHWRASNQMRVQNTDLARQLGSETLTARLWLLRPGQASTKHRHVAETEIYVVLAGIGRMRIGEEVHALEPHSSVLVEPDVVRQLFNDTADDTLWLVVGTPPEFASTLEMTPEQLELLYPDGPQALPPELA